MGKSSVMYECGVFERGEESVKAVGGFVQIWVPREGLKSDGKGIEDRVRVALEGLMGSSSSESGTGTEPKAKL